MIETSGLYKPSPRMAARIAEYERLSELQWDAFDALPKDEVDAEVSRQWEAMRGAPGSGLTLWVTAVERAKEKLVPLDTFRQTREPE